MTTEAQYGSARSLDVYGLNRSDLLRLVAIVADYRVFGGIPITAREVNNMLSREEGDQFTGGLSHLERRGFLRYVGKAEHPNSKAFLPTPLALQKFPAPSDPVPGLCACPGCIDVLEETAAEAVA